MEKRAPEDDGVHGRDSIGLAISGGGLRATLFSLGVVLYLVQSGASQHIRLISSVSGGSITNALLALIGFQTATRDQIVRVVGRAARNIANEGTFFLPRRGYWVGIFAGSAFAVLAMLGLGQILGTSRREALSAALLLAIAIALIFAIYWFCRLVLFRKALQIWAYTDFLGKVLADGSSRSEQRLRMREMQRFGLSDLPGSKVRHVFCATELVSGRPFYMSPAQLTSPAYGACEPNMHLAHAIYASAAFPGVFPPLRLRTKAMGLRGGDEPMRPRDLVLADGGVYNNLGTDWFDDSSRPVSMLYDFGDDVPVSRRIIVNASAPRRVRPIPRWWPARTILGLARIFGVMYENTVSPRLEALNMSAHNGRVAVVDIAFSTATAARALCDSPDDQIAERATALTDLLGRGSLAGYLDKVAAGSSGTRTTLSRIGEAETVQLLIHGYLSALVVCHSILGTDVVMAERRWFEDIMTPHTGRSHSNESGAGTAAPST